MIDLSAGSLVSYQGERYRIVRPHDLELILAESVDTGRLRELPIHALTVGNDELDSSPTLEELSPDEKDVAQHRYELIKPLLSLAPRPREAVEARARETGTSAATLYRYLNLFESGGHISVLGRRGRSDAGKSRQSPELLALMDAVIQDKYLKRQQHSVTHTYQELKLRCHKLGLKPPSFNTLSRRIQKIAPQERMRRRRGASKAEKLRSLRGALPGADAPWDIIQIDHTQLDIILVTEDGREVAQRPYITVAIDSYSRVVLGYHVSRDAPSYFSAGACLTHAMLPKDDYLAGHQKRLSELLQETLKDHTEVQETVPTLRWPVWGKPTK